MIIYRLLTAFYLLLISVGLSAQSNNAQNPIIHADVPDASIIRVGDTYYMSSTTMHMTPGLPIMKSKDLINWEIVRYAYNRLGESDAVNLKNGKDMYGRGTWASCLRYVNGMFYVSTFSSTTGKTYIYSTTDIENGEWTINTFSPSYHDHSLFFDDDGKIYMIWGAGELKMIELKKDLSGVKEGTERVIIEKAHAPVDKPIMLPAEGTQIFRVNGKYYLYNISWPRGGMRTVIIHRADKITGPYEGRVALEDKGVAQGGLIDTPDGRWFSYLFRDFGAVGRIPYLVPVQWKEGWPVLGVDGEVPMMLDLPSNQSLIPGIVAPDNFERDEGDPQLPLVWQWNHNPANELWSINGKKGYLRLTTGRTDNGIITAKNTLTQRVVGPASEASTVVKVSKMKEGDFAGITLFQKRYGIVGVKHEGDSKYIVMVKNESDNDEPEEIERIPLKQKTVYLKAVGDFNERKDIGTFYYSLDGDNWTQIGSELQMRYTLPHFMGYRYGLFYYATKSPGGYVDFDFFNVTDQVVK